MPNFFCKATMRLEILKSILMGRHPLHGRASIFNSRWFYLPEIRQSNCLKAIKMQSRFHQLQRQSSSACSRPWRSWSPLALAAVLIVIISGCAKRPEEHHAEHHLVKVTSAIAKDMQITEQYVSQIHSCRHIELRALESGYLEEIKIKEGQFVKKGDILFRVLATLYQARLESDIAEAQLVEIEYKNTKKLFEQKVVSEQEVALAQAKLAKANAKVKLAQAELNFTEVKAPFDGIIDRLRQQQGSLVAEGDILTTLSDNNVMWAYFNVPEARYLAYQQEVKDGQADVKVELVLANHTTFPLPGKISAIEADFNNTTGNIAFRADFPNPDQLLRHGQTGTILLSKTLKDAVVIPQRATFEILAKRFVYVVEPVPEGDGEGKDEPVMADSHEAKAHTESDHDGDDAKEDKKSSVKPAEKRPPLPREKKQHDDKQHDDHLKNLSPEHHAEHHANTLKGIVRQREIQIRNEKDDIFIIRSGLKADDRIVLEGVRQVRDGDEVEYEYIDPAEVLGHLKNKAE